jgi:hypothetical protein
MARVFAGGYARGRSKPRPYDRSATERRGRTRTYYGDATDQADILFRRSRR